jgi:uncharacterized protein YycO
MMKRRKKIKKKISLDSYYSTFSIQEKKGVATVMCRHYDQNIPTTASDSSSESIITPEFKGISPNEVIEDQAHNQSYASSYSLIHDMWDDNNYIEPFDYEVEGDDYAYANVADPKKENGGVTDNHECNCNSHENSNKEDFTKDKKEDEIKTPSDAPVSKASTVKEDSEMFSISEDDLLADMQSIIRGEKVFDKESGVMKSRSEDGNNHSSTKSRKNVNSHSRQDEDSLDQLLAKKKNEHQIFDKIAESMQYANAYDLGSFPMEKRFDEFDEIETLSKPKGFKQEKMTSTVNESKGQSVSSQDFIEDLDQIQRNIEYSGQKSETLSKEIPLDPGIGGMSIPYSELRPGDVILSTTSQPISGLIRSVTGSEVSHAAIFAGDGFLVEATEDGVLKLSLDTALEHASVAVAYRHKDITDSKRAKIIQFIDKAVKDKSKFDYKALIKLLPSQLMERYCSTRPESERQACKKLADKLKFGTNKNNEFYCSELVILALKAADLDIALISPDWNTVQDIVQLNHDGNLNYIGHLKS